jgi:hypothetical protein
MRPYLRLLFSLVLASGALLIGESAALAQQPYYGPAYGPPPLPPGYYSPPPRRYAPAPYYYSPQAHEGFFVRFTLGVGYLSASESYHGATLSYSGFGVTAGGALGGAVAPNLILFGEILGTSVINADQNYGGSLGSSGYDVEMYGFGPGIAYYLEPANLYFSGTLAFTKISFSDTYSQYPAGDTNLGLGVSLMVGKEWWIGRRLGLGLAGQLHLASMSDPSNSTRMTAAAVSLLGSLTFN